MIKTRLLLCLMATLPLGMIIKFTRAFFRDTPKTIDPLTYTANMVLWVFVLIIVCVPLVGITMELNTESDEEAKRAKKERK